MQMVARRSKERIKNVVFTAEYAKFFNFISIIKFIYTPPPGNHLYISAEHFDES